MKYYIVAGEASGDLHASNLMRGIKASDPQAEFRYFGGDLMAAQGGTLTKHYRDMAFMGFVEVLMNLKSISANMNLCKADIVDFKPDAVILVDYPGFNLRIAQFAKEQGFKVFYYIAPKVWAWKEGRVKKLKQHVDKLFIIFPFEIPYFEKHGVTAEFYGNPLLDAIEQRTDLDKSFAEFVESNGLLSKPIIALVAGSRKQEIKHNLPVMLTMVKHFPDYQFVIAGAPSLGLDVYKPYLTDSRVSLIYNQTYPLFKHSTVALVTSGTATLESALLNTPEVVCYKGSLISVLIAWIVIKVKYISLVNLIMDREAVVELTQFELNEHRLRDEVSRLLPGSRHRETMLDDFKKLQKMLGGSGASQRVGSAIVSEISNG
ncbi:MAG: lipid-A-disaccharide synthase [Bacteroidales bacterium]|nr:lipid-A-disaccharide synthase [Bacteroidales bacterium]MBN2749256.1 lipid-A-disaccharide synthase [Bacteroidales bacterium]